MELLSYEDQIYLLYFWLRTNIAGIDQVASVRDLKMVITNQLLVEWNMDDADAIQEILDLFCEQTPWDQLPE